MRLNLYKLCQLSSGVLIGLSFASCGGRIAQPAAPIGQFDSRLSCAHLKGEFDNNEKRLVELVGERDEQALNNLGLLLLTNPLFLDLSDTQKTEVSAIDTRQDNLLEIMKTRNCELPDIADDVSEISDPS